MNIFRESILSLTYSLLTLSFFHKIKSHSRNTYYIWEWRQRKWLPLPFSISYFRKYLIASCAEESEDCENQLGNLLSNSEKNPKKQ